MEVKFYESVEDSLLKYAVVIAVYNGRFIYCKHRERNTYEIPGGHREKNEAIEQTGRRELHEETGAVEYKIKPVCVYSVTEDSGEESFGMLYFAEIEKMEAELHHEIARICYLDRHPDNLTYPDIQPHLVAEAQRRGFI